MIYEKVDLYAYFNLPRPQSGQGYLIAYAHHPSQELDKRLRPAMLVCPGGGYWMRSDREGEPIALTFMKEGYSAFMLEYAVQTCHPTPLLEACMAMIYLRENAERYAVDGAHVGVIGFSAGGHLAASLATKFGAEEVVSVLGERAKLARPDGAVLSYPVVSMADGVTHEGTRKEITDGGRIDPNTLSIEKNVTAESVPAFIWHTAEDNCVPVENSFLLAQAYKRAGVPFALHIFEKGWHGLSLCDTALTNRVGERQPLFDEVKAWAPLCLQWLKNRGFEVRSAEEEE